MGSVVICPTVRGDLACRTSEGYSPFQRTRGLESAGTYAVHRPKSTTAAERGLGQGVQS